MLQQFYPQPPKHDFRFELNKDMNFAAAHFIPFEEAGKCKQVHGHTYFVNITVVGNELDKLGFLVNFQKLKKLVHDRYDHSVMNSHDEFANVPSTEIVAEQIHGIIQSYLDSEERGLECIQVVVRETPTSYVIYRPVWEEK